MCDFIIQIQSSEFTTPAALLFIISLVNELIKIANKKILFALFIYRTLLLDHRHR